MRLTLAALVVGSLASTTFAAPILIDDFSSSSAGYPISRTVVDAPGNLSGVLDTATVPGGFRNVGLGGVAYDVLGFDSARASVITAGSGFADFQSSSGATVNFGLSYGNVGPLNLDYSSVVSIEIDFLNYDAPANAPMSVTLRLFSTSGSSPVVSVISTPGTQTLSFPTATVPASILADVDGISFFFSSPKAADYRIDTITAVIPEPSTLALLALPTALLTRRRPLIA